MENFRCRARRLNSQDVVEGYVYEHEPPIRCMLGSAGVPKEPSKWFILQTGFADWSLPRPVEFIPVDPESIERILALPTL